MPTLPPTPTPLPTEPPTPEPTPLLSDPLPTPTAPAEALNEGPTDVALAVAGSSLDEKTIKKLESILRNTVKSKGVAGLQAAVRLPSGETWLGTAGKAELTPDRPVEDDTQFAIASVTKTFVSALILQLAEEGKLDLDVPFGTYFDDAPRSKTVTLRQLLSHTSGIYDYFGNPRYKAAAKAWWETRDATGLNARDHKWTYEEIMDLVKSGYCKPGECYRYSNTNYVILGQVAEAVGGAPIHKQLRKRFFKPLGMENTVYQPAEKPAADAAHGHWNYGSGYTDHTGDATVVPFMAAVSVADAAGAIASTAEDLSIWADALYGGEVLSEASLEQMTTFLRAGTYGLGTDVALFAGNRGHGHRGGLRGYESSMWYFPESGTSIVLLSNQGNWLTDEPMGKLVKAALGSA
ncbi:MAG: serine hydrolase domain-containing protein [Chloroflexota bacterium]|nr:serine hydrolase domain-containing protein [Chloroflexota bacterium]